MTERRPIAGYEGLYEIDRQGRVYSLSRITDGCVKNELKEKVVVQELNRRGYPRVALWKNHKRKRFLVHRLVAMTFIPNPDNLPIVNHKDENIKNPCDWNLEWATHSYNVLYSLGRREEPQYTTEVPDLPALSWT